MISAEGFHYDRNSSLQAKEPMQSARFNIVMLVAALLAFVLVITLTSIADTTEMTTLAVALAVVAGTGSVMASRAAKAQEQVARASDQQLAEATNRVEQAEAQIANLSHIDSLTGAYNHRYFLDLVGQQRALSIRGKYIFTIAVMEVDQYTAVVGQAGLATGDEVLQLFAQVVRAALREVDALARFDNEKFAMILSGASEEEAVMIINRIGQLVSQIHVNEQDDVKISASSGITSFHGAESVEELLANADDALSFAKAEGTGLVAGFNYEEPSAT